MELVVVVGMFLLSLRTRYWIRGGLGKGKGRTDGRFSKGMDLELERRICSLLNFFREKSLRHFL